MNTPKPRVEITIGEATLRPGGVVVIGLPVDLIDAEADAMRDAMKKSLPAKGVIVVTGAAQPFAFVINVEEAPDAPRD